MPFFPPQEVALAISRYLRDSHVAAAEEAAKLMATRRRLGRPVDFRATMIAAMALAARATLATRNFAHFSDLDVPVVNPSQA